MAKTHIETTSGFECDIDESALNDMELLDDLIALDQGDVLQFPTVIRKFLGPDDKKRLYDHLRGEDGRVPVDAFGVELADIIKGLQDKKK
ncbi:MAG: hypothetical protein VB055_06145 [Oscillospiraceae bacterium]|nr:hypothetical protein [Oscillospiraceae bacterium]